MVNYVCKRCGYSVSHKHNFIKHLNRKRNCKPILSDISIETLKLELEGKSLEGVGNVVVVVENVVEKSLQGVELIQCKFCKKKFKKKKYLTQHLKRYGNCKKKSNNDSLIENSTNDEKTSLIQLMSQQMEEMRKQHALEIEKLLEKVGNNNNNTHIENQQINIHINNHGKENLEYITDEYLSNLLKIPYGAVQKLIKNIHFHPKHPENHNVKITNKKLPYASVWKDDKWIVKDKKQVIQDMVDKSYNMIDEQYTEDIVLEPRKKKNFKIFQHKYDNDDKQLHKTLEKDTEMIILNNGDTL